MSFSSALLHETQGSQGVMPALRPEQGCRMSVGGDEEMSFLQKYLSRSPIDARRQQVAGAAAAAAAARETPLPNSDYGGSQENSQRKLAKDYDLEKAIQQFSGLVDKSNSEVSTLLAQQKDCCAGLQQVTKELGLMRSDLAALVGVLSNMAAAQGAPAIGLSGAGSGSGSFVAASSGIAAAGSVGDGSGAAVVGGRPGVSLTVTSIAVSSEAGGASGAASREKPCFLFGDARGMETIHNGAVCVKDDKTSPATDAAHEDDWLHCVPDQVAAPLATRTRLSPRQPQRRLGSLSPRRANRRPVLAPPPARTSNPHPAPSRCVKRQRLQGMSTADSEDQGCLRPSFMLDVFSDSESDGEM